MRRRRALTLIELMVVIILIGLISSVVAINVKGSLHKGKGFKTQQAQKTLEEIFWMQTEQGMTPQEFVDNPLRAVEESHLARDPASLLRDGWGNSFTFTLDDENEIRISSPRISPDGKLVTPESPSRQSLQNEQN